MHLKPPLALVAILALLAMHDLCVAEDAKQALPQNAKQNSTQIMREEVEGYTTPTLESEVDEPISEAELQRSKHHGSGKHHKKKCYFMGKPIPCPEKHEVHGKHGEKTHDDKYETKEERKYEKEDDKNKQKDDKHEKKYEERHKDDNYEKKPSYYQDEYYRKDPSVHENYGEYDDKYHYGDYSKGQKSYDTHDDDAYQHHHFQEHNSKDGSYYGDREFCRKQGACPEFEALQRTIAAQQGSITALQSEVAALNATVADLASKFPQPLPSIPFNEAECRATPIESFNSSIGFWVFTAPNGASIPINPCATPAQQTCTEVCALTSARCDPCAMSKLNCQNAYYYALKQSQLDPFFVAGEMLDLPQSPPGSNNWNQSTCANATFNGTSSLGYKDSTDLPGGNNIQAVCSFPNSPLYPSFYAQPGNYYDKTGENYIDPANLCDAPVWVITNGDSRPPFPAASGTGCFCWF